MDIDGVIDGVDDIDGCGVIDIEGVLLNDIDGVDDIDACGVNDKDIDGVDDIDGCGVNDKDIDGVADIDIVGVGVGVETIRERLGVTEGVTRRVGVGVGDGHLHPKTLHKKSLNHPIS